jgi:hypothetical protein
MKGTIEPVAARPGGLGEGTPPALESFDCNFLRIGDFLTIVFSEIGRI